MKSNSACAADHEEERSCLGYNSNSDEQDEEDLSLCDFPVDLNKDGNQTPCSTNKDDPQIIETQVVEEFDFGSVCGQVIQTQMCAADEVFFKGQILPLRLSISSDNGLTSFRRDSSRDASRCISRSESMDHVSLGGFRSISSGSTASSISSNSNSAAMTITRVTSESRVVRNQFHSHPSPKPQIRSSSSSARLERITSRNHHQKSSSSMWDFFRVGLVRTPPDIELQDLNYKVLRSNSRANKGSVSRNSSVNSSDNNTTIIHNNNKSNNNTSSKMEVLNNVVAEKQKRQRFIISGCKCSAETVASNAIIMKNRSCSDESSSGFNDVNDNINNSGAKTISTRAMKELKKKKQKQKAQQQGKRADLSNHRTYEWLKELSHANFPTYV